MKTFEQFLQSKKPIREADGMSDDIVAAAQQVATNTGISPGAANDKDAQKAMNDPTLKKVVKKEPAAGGQVMQFLTGKKPENNPTAAPAV